MKKVHLARRGRLHYGHGSGQLPQTVLDRLVPFLLRVFRWPKAMTRPRPHAPAAQSPSRLANTAFRPSRKRAPLIRGRLEMLDCRVVMRASDEVQRQQLVKIGVDEALMQVPLFRARFWQCARWKGRRLDQSSAATAGSLNSSRTISFNLATRPRYRFWTCRR